MITSRNLSGVSLFIICFGKLNISEKTKGTRRSLKVYVVRLSTDRRCSQSDRSGLCSSEIQWEVVSVTLVHHFHTKTSTVQNVCPSVEDMTLVVHDGLVEVESVEVERHRGNTKCGEPDANNRPCSKEEVQGTGVVE